MSGLILREKLNTNFGPVGSEGGGRVPGGVLKSYHRLQSMIHVLGTASISCVSVGLLSTAPITRPDRPVICEIFEISIVDNTVEAVLLTHHAVTEPIGCPRKFDGHVGRGFEPIELATVLEDRSHDTLLGQPLEEVVQDNPLIVPRHDAARLCKHRIRRSGPARQQGDDLVVEFQESQMGLRHDEILIIAMIADKRAPLAVARQIILEFACRHIHCAVFQGESWDPADLAAHWVLLACARTGTGCRRGPIRRVHRDRAEAS